MGHEYLGGNRHSFRDFKDYCAWCGGYINGKGYVVSFHHKKYHQRIIFTPYCSAKCFSEDSTLPLSHYENRVEGWLNSGNLEIYLKNESREKEKNRIEQEKTLEKAKQEKKIKLQWSIAKVVLGFILWVCLMKYFKIF